MAPKMIKVGYKITSLSLHLMYLCTPDQSILLTPEDPQQRSDQSSNSSLTWQVNIKEMTVIFRCGFHKQFPVEFIQVLLLEIGTVIWYLSRSWTCNMGIGSIFQFSARMKLWTHCYKKLVFWHSVNNWIKCIVNIDTFIHWELDWTHGYIVTIDRCFTHYVNS